jgi:hypothetical protein
MNVIPAGLSDLRPGDIGFGPLTDAAALAMWGQFILGEGFSIGKLNVGHVFVVTDSPQDGTVQIVEAMPHGARSAWMEKGGFGPNFPRMTERYAYARLPEDYPGQAEDAAAIARAMIGTPYSFASYAALAAWRLGFKAKRLERWIDRRRPFKPIPGFKGKPDAIGVYTLNTQMALPAEAICSVLADQAWALTGKQVMPRGTPHQCVTPGALAGALLRTPDATWMWPE